MAPEAVVTTAVVRAPRPAEGRWPEADGGATRKIDRSRPWEPAGVVLLAVALHKAAAPELLGLLAPGVSATAVSLANHLLALDSGTRKARLARDFGERTDASLRLRALFAALPDREHEIWRCLPEHHRRSYPHLAVATQGVQAPRSAVIERLVKEALR